MHVPSGISARRPTELELRESEARYKSALIAGRMGSWETDLIAGVRTWSKEGMALFGLDLLDGIGQVGGPADEYVAAFHPDDRHLVQHYHELAQRSDSFPAEYRIVRRDGATLWLAGRGLVVARTADGRAHRLVSIMGDVTDRHQAEEKLLLERERFALALEAGQMGAYDLDMATGVLWWSPQTYAIFGVDPGRFVPGLESVLALVHPDDRDTFVRLRAEAIAQRLPFVHELRIVRSDGRIAWIGSRGQTSYDGGGQPVRHFGITVDVTERKLAEQTLRDADRKKDGFIATLAHELRNPLAPIRNAINVLHRSRVVDAQVAWCRDVIDRQVGQMSHLLEDLLDVSRMTRGRFRLRREGLLLATVVERALEIAQPVIDEAGHTLSVELPAMPLGVYGDLTRLAQVFSNLLINAAKYTPPGGRIAVTVEREGAEVAVRIVDSGIGIGAEQMPMVFEMFAQLEPASHRAPDGLGIGLSLARRLVEMHGGSITARSDGVGLGSEFVVRLRLVEAASAAEPIAAEAPSEAGLEGEATSTAFRILVADDLRDSADSLAMLLESMGHTVEVAYDGASALLLGAAFRPEVAMLDLGMPDVDGYEAARRIRAAPWGSEVTLVAQTGWGQREDRRRTRDAGFDHHLVKPIDPQALAVLFATLEADRR